MTLAVAMFARPVQFASAAAKQSISKGFAVNDTLTKVRMIVDASRNCKYKVPDLLAKESRHLNAFDFAALMLAVEEHGCFWFESDRFFVSCNPNGRVSSVWLGGTEVYNSIWKNL